MVKLVKARECCLENVWGVRDKKGEVKLKTPKNVTDYGCVIAARLETMLYVGTEDNLVEGLNDLESKHGHWQVTKKDKVLQRMVRDALLEEFQSMTGRVEMQPDGKLEYILKRGGNVPEVCKRPELQTPVAKDVSLTLMRMPRLTRDGEHTRGMLMDKDIRARLPALLLRGIYCA